MAQLLSSFGADLTGLRRGASCAAREKTPSFLQPIRVCRHALVFEAGGETTLADCFTRGEHRLSDVELTEQRARTHVAMVREAGHPEPWIIALSQPPSGHRAFDYGLRWGIEAMFSDLKTRGFNLEDSQIARTDRLDRLVLVLA